MRASASVTTAASSLPVRFTQLRKHRFGNVFTEQSQMRLDLCSEQFVQFSFFDTKTITDDTQKDPLPAAIQRNLTSKTGKIPIQLAQNFFLRQSVAHESHSSRLNGCAELSYHAQGIKGIR
jgi:hypothetical protein